MRKMGKNAEKLRTALAEGQGFEPWEVCCFAGFQDRCFRPLSHPSGDAYAAFFVGRLQELGCTARQTCAGAAILPVPD